MKTQTTAEDSALTSLIFWCIFNGWLVFFVSLENNSLKKFFFNVFSGVLNSLLRLSFLLTMLFFASDRHSAYFN